MVLLHALSVHEPALRIVRRDGNLCTNHPARTILRIGNRHTLDGQLAEGLLGVGRTPRSRAGRDRRRRFGGRRADASIARRIGCCKRVFGRRPRAGKRRGRRDWRRLHDGLLGRRALAMCRSPCEPDRYGYKDTSHCGLRQSLNRFPLSRSHSVIRRHAPPKAACSPRANAAWPTSLARDPARGNPCPTNVAPAAKKTHRIGARGGRAGLCGACAKRVRRSCHPRRYAISMCYIQVQEPADARSKCKVKRVCRCETCSTMVQPEVPSKGY